MLNERFLKQIDFITEIDKLKNIFRQNVIIEGRRSENDAEHSWHMAVMAILLSEYAPEKIDVLKVIKILLIHDLVEIDAGDTFCYDEKGYLDKAEREQKCADRLFNILPKDQAEEFLNLWREFEEVETPEAKFSACLDRLQPSILNYNTEGHTWQKPGVNKEKVLKRNMIAEEAVPTFWEYITEVIIKDSVAKGYLKE
ncbi:MAG: HD domain-containing protein [Bacillota bacterium]|nr:HD domain-containing protein [Bacillota bacterium]